MFSIFYRTLQDLLDLGEDTISRKQALILCGLAYLFGVVMRSFYLWNSLGLENVLLGGVPMISTEDGYLFADYVRAHLNQEFTRYDIPFALEGGKGMITAITYVLVRVLPFSLEQTAVFMPLFIAPLLAVPVFYACRGLGSSIMGFFAALLAVISLPYIKRSSFAYFDTDLFSLTAPVAIIALGIYAIRKPGLVQVLAVVLMAEFTRWLDKPQIAEVVFLPFAIVYVLHHWRNPKVYQHIILMCFPFMSDTAWYLMMLYTLVAGGALYAVERYKPDLNLRVWQVLAAVAILYTIQQSGLWGVIRSYTGSYGTSGRVPTAGFAGSGWNFYKVASTIVEARQVDLFSLTRETSGFIFIFWLAFLGAILAVLRYPALAAGGAFIAIGLFALEGGIRFSLYLVPVLAIGGGYLACLGGKILSSQISALGRVRYSSHAVAALLALVLLYPGMKLTYNQKPRVVVQLPQAQMLKQLDELSDPDDYIISWWDYGYVMSFYSDMNNLINGARHGNDNYVVAKAMASTSQHLAANLIRESVEAFEEGGRGGVAINKVLGSRREGFNPNELINSMASPAYQLSRPKTREIFLYLPYQMLPIYGVIRYFSDLDINTGKVRRVPLIATRNFRIDQQNQKIILPNGVEVDLAQGALIDKGKEVGKINSVYSHQVDDNEQPQMETTNINGLGAYYVIVSSYYNIVYVMSAEAFRSNFVQMFFFNNHDPELFELVERNTFATTYRLRI